LRKYQYQFWHKENARTGIGTICTNTIYQYGHHMYDRTGIGIVGKRMPVPVQALRQRMPVPVQALRQYQYQYCHKGNARTGIGTIGKNKSYQYGHHMVLAKTTCSISGLALLELGRQYRYRHCENACTSTGIVRNKKTILEQAPRI
jgi:hypothetical protein